MKNKEILVMENNIKQLEKELQKQKEAYNKALRQEEVSRGLRYYVYFCLVDGRIKYIGKGTNDRWKHVIGGTSSCGSLNKDWFSGKQFHVYRTQDNLTEDEAYLREEIFINSFNADDTLYNKITPDENTIFEDWSLCVKEEDIVRYKTWHLGVMNKYFNRLIEEKYNGN